MSEATNCECKIEACLIDATECGGSWHTRISSSIGYQLFHFKRCFGCRQEAEQHDSLLAEVEQVKSDRDSWRRVAERLEADNARLVSEQQHCAKCGGVECHALAGLFCGEHSYEGCREWNGCPICVNTRLVGELDHERNKLGLERELRLRDKFRGASETRGGERPLPLHANRSDVDPATQLPEIDFQPNDSASAETKHLAGKRPEIPETYFQLREQNAALVEAATNFMSRESRQMPTPYGHDCQWCWTCFARAKVELKSALAASGRGK